MATSPLDTTARIAIIGGGISGLVAAKTLSELGYHNNYLFEAETELGGNSSTQAVQLGTDTRWADMGVNDYNTKTYLNIYRLICELGAVTAPLDDSTSYSTSDGTVSYTVDGLPNTSLPYPSMSKEAYDKFLADIKYFWTSVYEVANDEYFETKTVADYLAQPYNPNSSSATPHEFGPDFGAYYLLPRVNGMYFATAAGPQQMPILLVTHYYVLQEGYNQYGAPNPDRRYFVGGTRQLVDRIQDWLLNDYDLYATDPTADEAQGLSKFMLGQRVALRPTPGPSPEYFVTWTDPSTGDWREVGPFASVIMATHADAAAKCLSKLDPVTQPNLGAVLQNLAGYQYEASTAYIHTDARLLPVDVNAWRSFNIHIFEYDGPGPYNAPYTITYLENRHQNDALNLSYCLNPYNPQFFTTLNPPLDLLPRYILQSPKSEPAIKTFYHNVATMSTIGLQRELAQLQEQGALPGIYFTGGYTLGVGLHEECWISANHAARRATGRPISAALETYATSTNSSTDEVVGLVAPGPETYATAQPGHEKPAHYAPRYLRNALRAR